MIGWLLRGVHTLRASASPREPPFFYCKSARTLGPGFRRDDGGGGRTGVVSGGRSG
ncbi:hypothetical protein SPHINGOT1_330005 [Sphingomonas sp. T1]|nr:hypothetical protein SPHINGOT1_330005 [Sphingomonas sp. T1]